jgi:cell division protein ZapA
VISETESTVLVSVTILDKEYRIACQESEQEVLRTSAHYLDRRMREVRQSGRIIGADRIAVMAGLNISHELLDQRHVQALREQALNERIRALQTKIEHMLSDTREL